MHTPLRMCVVCRSMKPKSELFKFVKTENGAEIDKHMEKFGRGAYICKDKKCLELAQKKNALSKHFKMQVDKSVYECAEEAVKVE